MINQLSNDKLSKMKQFIDHELENIRSTYIQTPARIVSDYNNEVEKIKDYNGRQFLEMLQNADDESEIAIDKTAYIELTDTQLIIANNGNPFSEGGVQSLLYSYLSPKSTQQNKIGHKGTGFRSVLSWANSIYIKSEGLSIEFSRTNAVTYLEQLIKDHPSIQTLLTEKSNESHPIATLLTPKWRTDYYHTYNRYDTYIVLSIKEETKKDIQEQIDELDMEVLLFLQHLEHIVVRSSGRQIVMSKTVQSDQQVKISLEEDGKVIREKTWNLRKRAGVFEQKNFEVKIAFTDTLDDDTHLLYSFFKTNVRLPFPAIMHGTFELTGNRNYLTESPANAYVLDELIQLMIDTALEIANRSSNVSWEALKLLTFEENMDQNLINMEFDQKLLEKIKQNKLFPVISGTYYSYDQMPFYFRNPYADFLPSDHFPGLTIHTKEIKVIKLLSKLKLFTYDHNFMFTAINKVSKQWDVNNRARCIYYLMQDYRDQLKSLEYRQLLCIFIDQNGDEISSDAELFLPPENRNMNVPSFVSIQFMHDGLYKALQRVCNVQGARALTNALNIFNVQEYNLESVLRRTITQTRELAAKDKANQKNYISELLLFLYDIYKSRKNNEDFPSGLNVPLLNRLGNIYNASELYFGKDYNCFVTEQLLENVDNNLFVGSPKKLGLDHYDKSEIKYYLSWIGVAEFPRFTVRQITDEDYERDMFRHIPYPISLEGELFTHFEDLWNVKSWRTVINVESADRLDEILEKAPFASILVWLLKDPQALKLINEGREMNRNARASIPIQRKVNSRYLYANQIKSYFVWKLQTTKWIENAQGIKVDTRFCCLSKVIGSEFSPLIEVPAFDVNQGFLSAANILSEQVEALLMKLGVGHDLRHFSSETIYTILLNLPVIDPNGAKARGIYKQIIMNKSKVDKTNPSYLQFVKEGKVLAKKNGKKLYYPVSEAYYVENRTYCEEIMKHFPLLDLERRSGNQQVLSVLGVKPLVGLRFKLADKPLLHPLHDKFQPDFEEFKPFVYAYRLDKDNKHIELDRIKKLSIFLCTDIRASFTHHSQAHSFFIKDYEYITTDNSYQIYLKLPFDEHENMQDLRDDFKFNEVIAEIIAGVLRVEENRKDYRELYSKKTVQREELLRRELDDEQLVKLLKARNLLGITTDPTRNFWLAVLRALDVNISTLDIEREENFFYSIASATKLDPEFIHPFWTGIDYEEPSSVHSAPLLIRLFQTVGIDTHDFNTFTTTEANLKSYYLTTLDSLKMEHRSGFLSLLHRRLLQGTVQEQQRFIELRDHYSYWGAFNIHNSVSFDAYSAFENFLKEQCQIDLTELKSIEEMDLQAEYYRNREGLWEQLRQHGVTQVQFEAFAEKREQASLLYFGKVTELVNNYLTSNSSPHRGVSTQDVPGSDNKGALSTPTYANLFESMQLEKPNSTIKTVKTNRIEKNQTGPSNKREPSSRAMPLHNHAKNDEIGFLGEAYVYLALCEEYGKENVEWVSENGRRARNNEYGNDGEKHDIRYINKKGQLKYVEVKASTGLDKQFHISKEEVAFGEEKKDAYEIFIVLNVNSSEREILRIPGFFKYNREESFNQNSRFNVENRNFVIRFKEAAGSERG
ncbi:DUF3883 domain-containing protein [Paenibacillus sp. GCM10012303]|uniref:DUF3883 domain-containing protein n=1 Tax=Paenibacillus sp. GCM10012303 TaxID=3317340 RepID=UPI00361C7F61